MSKIEIAPLGQELSFGARIRGVDRDAIADPAICRRILDTFEERGMIVFEDLEPSNELQVGLSEIIGPLKEHPVAGIARVDADSMPGVVEIRSPAGSGGVVRIGDRLLSHWLPWHFDHCYNNELNRGAVLRAVDIVDEGGITGFVDGVALYKAFPKDLLARIEGREIVYTLNVQYETMRFGRPADFQVLRRKPSDVTGDGMPRAVHPAVWTRRTGEKVLHVSPWMAEGIVGAETAEGEALFEEISQEINRLAESLCYRHKWAPTDMVVWDNWRLLHSVSGHDPALERTMYRTTIKGDYGLGYFENDGIGGKILETTV